MCVLVFLYQCLCVPLSVCVSLSVSFSLSIFVSLYVYVSLIVFVSLYLCVSQSVCLSQIVCLCVCASVCLYMCLCVSLSVCFCDSLSVCVCFSLSVVCISFSLCVYLCDTLSVYVCLSLRDSFSVCVCLYFSVKQKTFNNSFTLGPQSLICDYFQVPKDYLMHAVVSNSLWPHGLQPTKLLCPQNFPGKNTGAGCHFLLQGIFPTQGSNLSPKFPALAGRFFTSEVPGRPQRII